MRDYDRKLKEVCICSIHNDIGNWLSAKEEKQKEILANTPDEDGWTKVVRRGRKLAHVRLDPRFLSVAFSYLLPLGVYHERQRSRSRHRHP